MGILLVDGWELELTTSSLFSAATPGNIKYRLCSRNVFASTSERTDFPIAAENSTLEAKTCQDTPGQAECNSGITHREAATPIQISVYHLLQRELGRFSLLAEIFFR